MKHTVGAFAAGLLYWSVVCWLDGTREPWDAQTYWTLAYPVSLVLSAVLGAYRRVRAWLSGAALTLAQIPIVAIQGEFSPLILAGLAFACVLAVPAMLASMTGYWLRRRMR